MQVGFNMLLFATHVTEEHFPLFEKIKQSGYDGVEIPVFEGDIAHYEKLFKELKNQGLAATSVTIIQDEAHSPISSDAGCRKQAVEYLKWAIDCTNAMGVRLLCGPYHQPVGVFSGQGPTEEEKQRAAQVHRAVAEHAAQMNVMLAMEYLNRFEAYFVNTLDDLADHVRRVNHPNFGGMFDSFHANIEEKDLSATIARNREHIQHVHICENDRGIPGQGHTDWPTVFGALRSSGYDGWLTVEVFGSVLPGLAAATRVWRDFFTSPDEVITESAKFIRQQWEAAKQYQ